MKSVNVLEYKGYLAKVEYSVEDRVLFGKIEGINDLVTFESPEPEEIENEFHMAVDDYLNLCEELGQIPDRAYSGTFNVRIQPDLHKKISLQATKNGETLNSMVEKALNSYFNNYTEKAVEEIWKAVYSMESQPTRVESYSLASVGNNMFLGKGAMVN